MNKHVKKHSFLRVRCVEVYKGDPRWAQKVGELVLDVKYLPFKLWFVLAMEVNGGFNDLRLKVVD